MGRTYKTVATFAGTVFGVLFLMVTRNCMFKPLSLTPALKDGCPNEKSIPVFKRTIEPQV